MATGIKNIAIKSKKFTGTTSSTGTLVIDTTGIYKVLGARARVPNDPYGNTGWRYTCFIRNDNYVQVVDTTTYSDRYSVMPSLSVEIEVFYI